MGIRTTDNRRSIHGYRRPTQRAMRCLVRQINAISPGRCRRQGPVDGTTDSAKDTYTRTVRPRRIKHRHSGDCHDTETEGAASHSRKGSHC
jgi:hypothetical protein